MLLIHQLSKETEVPIHTIRFYEKMGLFKGKKNEHKKSNNYTYYDEETIEKLSLIGDAKSIGFTLAEIKELIDVWYGKRITKTQKLNILRQKQEEINQKIKQLQQVKKLIVDFCKEVEMNDC